MPVYKYSSYEQAGQALWNFNPDADYFLSVHELFMLSEKLNPPLCRRGLWKFRTSEEAREQRLDTELENALNHKERKQ
jgi:hypothetical protein